MKQSDWFDEFEEKRKARLEMGKEKYGDALENDHDLIEDLEYELFDLANYSYLIYARLQKIKGELPDYAKGGEKTNG